MKRYFYVFLSGLIIVAFFVALIFSINSTKNNITNIQEHIDTESSSELVQEDFHFLAEKFLIEGKYEDVYDMLAEVDDGQKSEIEALLDESYSSYVLGKLNNANLSVQERLTFSWNSSYLSANSLGSISEVYDKMKEEYISSLIESVKEMPAEDALKALRKSQFYSQSKLIQTTYESVRDEHIETVLSQCEDVYLKNHSATEVVQFLDKVAKYASNNELIKERSKWFYRETKEVTSLEPWFKGDYIRINTEESTYGTCVTGEDIQSWIGGYGKVEYNLGTTNELRTLSCDLFVNMSAADQSYNEVYSTIEIYFDDVMGFSYDGFNKKQGLLHEEISIPGGTRFVKFVFDGFDVGVANAKLKY